LEGSRRIHAPIVGPEIIDGKVWLQADNADLRIAERLEEAGIPIGLWRAYAAAIVFYGQRANRKAAFGG
jgi:hypothetical protein